MRVLVVGGKAQARLVHNMLLREGHSAPIVFDRDPGIAPPWECLVFSDETKLWDRARECEGFVVCIGGEQGADRVAYSQRLIELGLKPITVIHHSAFLGERVVLGRGLQIMPRAVVNDFVKIGNDCILNTNCSIDHDCQIGQGVHVMGAAAIAGAVSIGDFSSIGTNATVLPNVQIGKNAVVGAGAVVTKDVPEGVTVVGVPARIVAPRR